MVCSYFKKFINNQFGMIIKDDGIKIVDDKYIKYLEPLYDEDTKGGISHLKPYGIKFRESEPGHGEQLSTSHRWSYYFKNTWKFLRFSMKEDGSMIRPTSEILERLVNPEKPVESLDQHIPSLKMALLENLDNKHTQNRLYFYLTHQYSLAAVELILDD